jgi:biopolymer transport protein ExbD
MGGGIGGGEARSGGSSILQTYSALRRANGGGGTLSEINVTPFVDVVLVLLIIFMITAPMLIRAMDVSLPAAGLRQDQATERVVVTVDREGRTFLDNEAVNPLLLEERLRQKVESRGLRVAYLKADENLLYKQVISFMDLIKRAGVDTIGMVYVYPEEKAAR